jgi:DNA polymerase-3 subunit alpha
MHKETWSVYAKRADRSRPPGIMTWAGDLAMLGKTAHTKEIPVAAFELTNRQIGLLLSRMWEGDGHINEAGRSLFYATASERMARQMQHLFLRLDILSRLRTVEFPYKDGRTGYQLFVTGNANFAAFAEKVAVHFVSPERRAMLDRLVLDEDPIAGTKDIVPLGVKETVRAAKAQAGVTWTQLNVETGVAQREFYPVGNGAKSGYHRHTIQRLADYFAHTEQGPDLRRYADNDIYWDRVVEITPVGEKQTYDLEVPGTHNFVANDILVHNSHAADYAVITVQTAYLKAHYPVDYMAALLLIERDKTEKVINFINECRRMGIQVLPPDVNYSGLDFEIQAVPADSDVGAATKDPGLSFNFPVPEGSAIRYGMAAVKNVGEGPVRVIIAARDEGGPFASLEDFCDRTDLRQVGKRALECLIKVGAFDRFGARSRLLDVMDEMVARSAGIHSARESGQLSMFDLMGSAGEVVTAPIVLPKIDEASPRERLQWEKELVGVYVTSHPLEQVGANWQRVVTCSCAELDDRYHDRNVVMAGMINDVRAIFTKKGDAMAFVKLEDLQGQCEVVVFPRTYAEFRDLLEPENVILVKGKAQTREGRTSVLADTIQNFITVTGAVGDSEPSARQPILMDLPTINGVPVASADIVADLAGDLIEDLDFSGPDLGEDGADEDDLGPAAVGPVILPAQDAATIADDLLNLAPPPEPYWEETPPPKGKLIHEAPAQAPQPVQAKASAPKPQATAAVPPPPKGDPPASAPILAPAPKQAEALDAPVKKGLDRATSRGANSGDSRGDSKGNSSGESSGNNQGNNRGGNGDGAGGGRSNGGRTMRIVFQRSGNLDRDKYRLKEIYDRVRDPRGRDHFAIVVESQGRRHLLQFPDDPCTISDRLVTELTKHFRLEVHVE